MFPSNIICHRPPTRARVCGGGLIQHSDSSELTQGLRGADEEEDTATRVRDDHGESSCPRREGRGGDEDGLDSRRSPHFYRINSSDRPDLPVRSIMSNVCMVVCDPLTFMGASGCCGSWSPVTMAMRWIGGSTRRGHPTRSRRMDGSGTSAHMSE
jgi:hypothetical protein